MVCGKSDVSRTAHGHREVLLTVSAPAGNNTEYQQYQQCGQRPRYSCTHTVKGDSTDVLDHLFLLGDRQLSGASCQGVEESADDRLLAIVLLQYQCQLTVARW